MTRGEEGEGKEARKKSDEESYRGVSVERERIRME